MATLVDEDTFKFIMVCVMLFGSLHVAIRTPPNVATIVARLLKYSIIFNYLMLFLSRSLSLDTRAIMTFGGIWGFFVHLLLIGRTHTSTE